MPIVPYGFVNEAKIKAGVEAARKALAAEVVRIRYDIGEDWTGAPSIFFRVLLSDNAIRNDNHRELAQRISSKILSKVKAEEIGLLAYFNYRTLSEQKQLKEPAWA